MFRRGRNLFARGARGALLHCCACYFEIVLAMSSARCLAEVCEERWYVQNETLPFEEDERNEFKMHTCFCEEEVPPLCKRRKAISR